MADRESRTKIEKGFVRGFALGLGMLIVILGGALAFQAGLKHERPATGPTAVTATSAASLSKEFEEVARRVEPAVVNINTEQIVHNTAGQMPDGMDQFFGNSPFGSFFGNEPHDFKQRSLGSGFIVNSGGYILTNNHVVENASRIRVKLSDGREMEAKVVGTDPQTDLAVLKIPASNLPTLNMADSGKVEVGDWVLAFGSPFGLSQTMTAGIISAKGRAIGAGPYDNFLQTDAAINPGNSGGPLVDLDGNVVGINTMIASESGGFQGIGFAIPASMAENVYGQLVKDGKVTRGWLGVRIQALTPELAKGFGVKAEEGVLVAAVDSDSPAGHAGLKSGDIVLGFDGKEVHSPQDLSLAVAATKVGSTSKVAVLRKGERLSLDVKVGERPGEVAEKARAAEPEAQGKLGIGVEDLTPQVAREMKLDSDQGVLVTEVKPGSPADDGGVRPGDVVREINRAPVNKTSDLVAAVHELKSGANVLLKVERQGLPLFLAFELS
jgi:serine protease Do